MVEEGWKSHAIYPFLCEGISESRHFVSGFLISCKMSIKLEHVDSKACPRILDISMFCHQRVTESIASNR